MAAPTLIRREHKNARLYFIPTGETVDAVSVSLGNATWPDNVPTANWTAYQFADIETVKEEKQVETEEFKIPKATGGYSIDTEETLLKRIWTATSAKTNSILKQLEHALASAVVASTPQSPFVKNDNFIEGIMLMEIQNKNGVIIERTQVWARLRLVTAGDVGPATSKVEFSLEQREHANNTYVAYAG
jgi:hypothetical protein